MKIFELFLSFVQVGLLSIGGGYAAIPLIQSETVTRHAWLTCTSSRTWSPSPR